MGTVHNQDGGVWGGGCHICLQCLESEQARIQGEWWTLVVIRKFLHVSPITINILVTTHNARNFNLGRTLNCLLALFSVFVSAYKLCGHRCGIGWPCTTLHWSIESFRLGQGLVPLCCWSADVVPLGPSEAQGSLLKPTFCTTRQLGLGPVVLGNFWVWI